MWLPHWLHKRLSTSRRHRRRGLTRGTRAWRRRPYPLAAIQAYRRSVNWGERLSRFAHESVELPAYETAALVGQRPPRRFRWRRQWYTVVDVMACWVDGRQREPDNPEYGRVYFVVETAPSGLYQIYYEHPEKRGARGRWMVYRRVEYRPSHSRRTEHEGTGR